AFAANQASVSQMSPEAAAQDVRKLKATLIALHPALTKYRTQAEIDEAFAQFEQRGKAATTSSMMYLAATELAAAIRCGHTWTNVLNQSGGSKAALLDANNKLPFTMTLVEDRWLVLASAVSSIKAGDEILSVNGIKAHDMVKMMLPYLRADGSSDGKRLRDRKDFSQMDIVWPLLSPPQAGRYQVQLRRSINGKDQGFTHQEKAVSMAARNEILKNQGVREPDETWRLKIDQHVAYLTLPTFSFWNSKFDWKQFIDQSFATILEKQVTHLVIDVRDNEGGDGAIGGKLLSHLIKQPFQFTSDQAVTNYERVPYKLVRYLDTWDYSFFDRTGKVEKISDGTAKGKYQVTARAGLVQTIAPVATPFQGKVFLLVSAENSSATFQLAKLSQESGAAILVGQQTGGNQRGLNGGELTWVAMPNSGVAVDIPLLATRYTETTPDASITPDIQVQRTFAARLAGRDLEMEAVKAMIQKTSAEHKP
ncbi:S41 family peptidase, partial [Undibacterium sp.]|uniref:S41 family peptidase n=1 Tax=Undibacterium sp. TaxID=1914977 RepID=UPI003750D889